MSTAEVPVNGRFPQENIQGHGPIQIHSMTATVAMAASDTPFKNVILQVLKVEMSCTGNLDTHTILVEDASLLRMFLVKNNAVFIDLDALNVPVLVFALEAAGPMPDNEGEEDTDEDFEMLQNAWKTCRLVWKRGKDVAGQASSANRTEIPVVRSGSGLNGKRRRVYTQQTADPSRTPKTLKSSVQIGGGAIPQPEDDKRLSNAAVAPILGGNSSTEHHSEQDFKDYDEAEYDDENDEDFDQSTKVKMKRPGTHKAPTSSKKAMRKRPTKPISSAAPRNVKPRNPTVMIWPTTIITTGTAGGRLRPLMAEMGKILTTDAQREEYMDLVWTRRRAAEGDDIANQAVVHDLETFVRAHGIVNQHNLWARWMESGIKTAMPMYKPIGTGEMDATERKQMFERKKARRA
ncbi:hypothetical protein AA0113_g10637 [Alternaria arborescens]|uniref:Uncharacterized protein n=1 Tax=Alternaria arborescens TaxID=156630 RepID=A0A4Q4QNB0_9PLEO|nr:hypothetical protein AA0111_g10403 [Alternaria arborescens]RYN18201.1 hypothetical protein AA0112_g11682 [Alternaria arborescens]RYO19253.1 hypothetical protein AA0111_g10403 [Alternaria arborescens]RYO44901.1 hypothetical protein AA0113_g10637 [Alternaria arborescens]